MGWSATRVGRADNRAKHAARSACSVGGRLVIHVTKRLRGPRATGLERDSYGDSRPQPPAGRGVGAKKPRSTAWGGARRELAALTTAPSPQHAMRALWAVGWLSTGRSARGPRATGLDWDGDGDPKPQPPAWHSVCGRSLGQRRRMEHVASWLHRQPRQVRSAQCVLCGRSADSPLDEARSRRAPRDEKETATTVQSRSRRPGPA